ncbi:NUDIX domain-containing protein [Motiliproteus sp.]|uniref:NUDIX domain-containing protein n=1 Tax=Motiliproteus sp. TaxID=1898955 RepID=UPI003BAD6AE4
MTTDDSTSNGKPDTLSTPAESSATLGVEAANPWTRLASKLIYENPWIRIREDKVLTPSGSEGIYGLVKFRNRAVAIIPIDNEGYTWLVGQYRYALGDYSWEVPMGGHPVELDPLDGAHKELREETGLRAQQMTEFLRVQISNSVTDELGVAYLAQQLTPGETDFDDTEQLQIRRLPFDDAIAMCLDGRIQDLFSIAALQQLALRRSEFGV